MIDLTGRIRILVRPEERASLRGFVCDALGLQPAVEEAPDLVWRFSSGASLIAEFSDDALPAELARRGACIEIVAGDRRGLEDRIRSLGAQVFTEGFPPTTYFEMPGGQVVRLSAPQDL